jgi:hypothetical protein
MWCWTINLTRGTVREEKLDERAVEFPRIDDRLVGVPARYGVTVGTGTLVCYDLERSIAEEHRFGAALSPGDRVRPCLLWPIRANSPADICPMSMTRFETAATS